ncbi:hypothetical protein [Thiocystis violacea]|uniref:hypothetical protein n=1 Tax=Thiocystis violacea TaxID=13725 RepID=UPI0019046E75|nr:hypothetical protein [Thiocystis violacea]MBK1725218.1 hypothetical protein [Thiocystis violacea]
MPAGGEAPERRLPRVDRDHQHLAQPIAVRALYEWLREHHREAVFATDALSKHYKPARDFTASASGLLAVRAGQSQGNAERAFLWWRPEQPQSVHWAGDPRKGAVFSNQSKTLSPRASFERWVETTFGHNGHSAPRDSTDVVFFSGIDSAARGWVDKVLLWYLERA